MAFVLVFLWDAFSYCLATSLMRAAYVAWSTLTVNLSIINYFLCKPNLLKLMLPVNHPSAVPDESFVFTAQSSERSRTYVKKHCLNNIAAFADIPSWVPRTQRCSSALVVLQQGTQQSRAAWNLSAAAQLLCCFFCPNQLWRQKIHPSHLKVYIFFL